MGRRMITSAAAVALMSLAAAIPVRADSITQIFIPDSNYISQTTLIDISGLTNRQNYGSITDGGVTVTFSSSMERLTIPTTWAGWGSYQNPDGTTPGPTEDNSAKCPQGVTANCPPVLWSRGQSSITMVLNTPTNIFGFEAEPNSPRQDKMTAYFYGNAAGTDLIGSFFRNPSGYNGALLFAASSDRPIMSVKLTDTGPPSGTACPSGQTCDFAIANVRVVPVPEPSSLVLLGTALAGAWFGKRHRMKRNPG
jgi:hypothetical protein